MLPFQKLARADTSPRSAWMPSPVVQAMIQQFKIGSPRSAAIRESMYRATGHVITTARAVYAAAATHVRPNIIRSALQEARPNEVSTHAFRRSSNNPRRFAHLSKKKWAGQERPS